MQTAQTINISLHVLSGAVAIGIGFFMLAKQKGTPLHRKLGRVFAYFTLLVCMFAAFGLVLFRFMPLFAVLTVLVTYQLVSAWHTVYTRERGPSAFDAVLTVVGVAVSIALVPFLLAHEGGVSRVVYATLGGLATVLIYDLIRWLFPRRWYSSLWLYEHVGKMIGVLFGMVSALVGNVVRFGQPWSQLLPTVLGMIVTVYFFVRLRHLSRSLSTAKV